MHQDAAMFPRTVGNEHAASNISSSSSADTAEAEQNGGIVH